MVGYKIFTEAFANFSDCYVLIGGAACNTQLEAAAMPFRVTKDLDIVLVLEVLEDEAERAREFGTQLWSFIEKAGYSVRERYDGTPELMCFSNPRVQGYPQMLELFSRTPKNILGDKASYCAPLHLDDAVSSLSVLLLDKDYYEMLKKNMNIVDGTPLLNPYGLIAFKAKAYMDLSRRKKNGEAVDQKNITKHKNDVFRLISLLTEGEGSCEIESVRNEVHAFADAMEHEQVDLRFLKEIGTKEEALALLRERY